MRETQRAALVQKPLVQADSSVRIFRCEVKLLNILDLRLNESLAQGLKGGRLRPSKNIVAIGSAPRPGRVRSGSQRLSKHPLVETFFRPRETFRAPAVLYGYGN